MSEITMRLEMVINKSYGGFGLSPEAQRELARRKGKTLYQKGSFLYVEGTHKTITGLVRRDDPDLIAVVREMGARKRQSAKLQIVTVEVQLDITDYDGLEKVEVTGYEVD